VLPALQVLEALAVPFYNKQIWKEISKTKVAKQISQLIFNPEKQENK